MKGFSPKQPAAVYGTIRSENTFYTYLFLLIFMKSLDIIYFYNKGQPPPEGTSRSLTKNYSLVIYFSYYNNTPNK